MKKVSLCLFVGLAAVAGYAHADVTFTYLFTDGYPLSISSDGTVVAGNNYSDYGPFRWTQETGRVELGMASAPVLGRSAGIARVSQDGTKVASTVHSNDSTVVTSGLWTLGQGWQQLMPPSPPDAGSTDNDLSSVWGMSGDGSTVVGLYWRSGFGRANGYRWTQATGAVSLGSTGGASRAQAANYDGSVIGGWDEHPTGFWRATVWVNGQQSLLGLDQWGEVRAINNYGNIAAGYQRDPVTDIRQAAMWKRNGGAWGPTQLLGYLPGTSPGYGINRVEGISTDGNMAVGYCTFGGDPFYTTGFIWTPSTGIVDVNQFLADNGILPDPSFSIQSMTAVTPDGKVLVGFGKDVVQPFKTRAFMIRLDDAVDVATSPSRVQLSAQPNPLRTATTLQFNLANADTGSLCIYDSAGRLVRRLLDGAIPAGPRQVTWDGRDATGSRVVSGVYYTRLETGSNRVTGKLVVLQ